MRKFFTLSAFCLFGLATAFAQFNFSTEGCGRTLTGEMPTPKNYKAVDLNGQITKSLSTRAGMEPITEEPQGQTKWYWMNDAGTYPSGGTINWHTMTDGAARVYWADDNKVYFRDFFEVEESYDLGITTYMEGEVRGGKIVFQLPQALFELMPGSGVYVCAQAYTKTDEGYFPDESITEVEFDYNPLTNEIDFPGIGENSGLGMFYIGGDFTGWWTGYSIEYKNFVFNDVQMVTIPEGATRVPYICYLSEEFNFQTNVYFDGDNFYFTGLSLDFPQLTCMGELTDSFICEIKSRQFVGTANYCFLWNTAQDYYTGNLLPAYNFYFDPATGDFYLLDVDVNFCYGLFAKFPTGTEVFLPIIQYVNFSLFIINNQDGIPQDPYDLMYNEEEIDFGYRSFWFNLPSIGTNDNFLNTDDLYYVIYRNYELMEFNFDMDEYQYPSARNLVEIPYNFSNGFDIYHVSTLHHVGIYDLYSYADPTEYLSVQQFYNYQGEVTYSNLVTLNVNTGQVTVEDFGYENVETITAPVASEDWYDLSGRRIANPGKGLFIKKVTHEDGTVRSLKTIRK